MKVEYHIRQEMQSQLTITDTPDFQVPHAEPKLESVAAETTPKYPIPTAHDGHISLSSTGALR